MKLRKRWVIPIAVALFLAIAAGGWWHYTRTPGYRARKLVAELREDCVRVRQAPGLVERLMVRLRMKKKEKRRPLFYSITDDLAALGRPAVPFLLEALGDEAPCVRGISIVALGEIGPEAREAVPLLAQALKDTGSPRHHGCRYTTSLWSRGKIRYLAAKALSQIGPASVPYLVEALADQDAALRLTAAVSLRPIGAGAAEAIPALRKALEDEDENVRFHAAVALASIQRRAGIHTAEGGE